MGSTGGREGVPVLINKAPLSGSREGEQELGPHLMEGWGPPPLFNPCGWEPLDSRHSMGSVPKNTERGGFRKTSQCSSQARASHLDLSFLPLFF